MRGPNHNPSPAHMPLSIQTFRRDGDPLHAFTLIELLTVIAIIGILAAIIIPTVGKVRETARTAQCLSNIRQIGTAFSIYAMDNKGKWPPIYYQEDRTRDWLDVTHQIIYSRPYTKEQLKPSIFACPSAMAQGETNVSYGFNSQLRIFSLFVADSQRNPLDPSKIATPSRTCMVIENGNEVAGSSRLAELHLAQARHKKRYNILFSDSHVATWPLDRIPVDSTTVDGAVFWLGQ